MTPHRFKDLMRHHAAAVVLITTDGHNRAALIATSFTSVSADPPLVLFCIARTASAWPALSEADQIGIHLPAEDGRELARHLSTTGNDRFAHPAITSDHELTVVAGAVAWFACRIVDRFEAGDHDIVLAAPLHGGLGSHNPRTPLLYYNRYYARITD